MTKSTRRKKRTKLNRVICRGCHRSFTQGSGLTQHMLSSSHCAEVAASAIQVPAAPVQTDQPPPPDTTMQQNRDETVDHQFPPYAFQDESVFPDPDFSDHDNMDSSDTFDQDIRDLLDRYEKHTASGFANMPIPSDMKVKIELINILREGCAPLNLIKKIWEWARKAVLQEIDFTDSCTRASVIKFLKQRYGTLGICNPIVDKVLLPNAQQSIDIVRFDFLDQLYSLLSDPDINRPENLIFPGDDPFEAPEKIKPNHQMTDFIDGSVYRIAYHEHVKIPGTDVLCPIIFFIDKTYVDRQGRLTLEPISFTLGIFNKSTRRKFRAWHTLGFVNNFANIRYTGDSTAADKAQDYHFILDTILSSYVIAQQKNGVLWKLKYRIVDGEQYKKLSRTVSLKIPLLLVLGDTEGHDKLCGKYSSRPKKNSEMPMGHMCRYCDCPRNKISVPIAWNKSGWKYTQPSMIKGLVDNKDHEALKSISY